ncbi:MAG: acetate--CoA ligase [Holosporales bacterium]|jgi:acetyl-CoA synthetase|nr:acetate--CoA ligase [Holosporales bacterium]
MLFDHELAWINEKIYNEIYKNSISNTADFWEYHIQSISWHKTPYDIFDHKTKSWLSGGVANVCYNCVDRHAEQTPNKPAIVWHGDEKGVRREISYKELQRKIVEISSLLLSKGIKKGDVVGIHMPMTPDAVASMLACARIGAIHLVVFAGFSANSLAYRLEMSNAKVLITSAETRRGGKPIKIKENCQEAIAIMTNKPELIVIDEVNLFNNLKLNEHLELCTDKDDLFVLYTSGSSGKPKGIIHSSLQYILYAATTFKFVFNIDPHDIYFCTSDIGWITGHSYITYAPLFHGLTIVMFEGTPIYPTADRYWEIIERERVSVFYTAPTALRSLQTFDENFVKKHDLSSLKVLGSVGEPINKKAWEWYFNVVGNRHCPIVDTWWQTETGGIVLAPLLDINNQKPCIAGKPFFGIKTDIVNTDSKRVTQPMEEGRLIIENNWPGMCRSVLYECEYSQKSTSKNQTCKNIFLNQYFEDNKFITGDGALYDEDFDIKIIGRLDDVINISGHRLSTIEIEEAIYKVNTVKDCAVVAIDHKIKGQTPFAFVVKNLVDECEDELKKSIIESIRKYIGPIAKPDYIVFVEDLPKTRSGKIVRQLLREIVMNREYDITTISSVHNKEILLSIVQTVSDISVN